VLPLIVFAADEIAFGILVDMCEAAAPALQVVHL